jgi:hypothetical protein
MLLIFAATLLVGCAAQPSRNVVYVDCEQMTPVAAAALVFDPPVTDPIPRYDYDRDARQPQAYVGYQESVATFFYTRTDDHQMNYPSARSGSGSSSSGNLGYYEREAVSETVGVQYR